MSDYIFHAGLVAILAMGIFASYMLHVAFRAEHKARTAKYAGGDPETDALATLIERQPAFLSTGSDQQDWFRAREVAETILKDGYRKEAR